MPDTTHPPVSQAEADRHAYNAAFEQLGLNWCWDAQTYERVRGPQGLRAWLEAEHSHLLRAYEADFLVGAIEAGKARHGADFGAASAHATGHAQPRDRAPAAAH